LCTRRRRPQKYAIKFYLLIYGRIQICIDYANGIGLANGSGFRLWALILILILIRIQILETGPGNAGFNQSGFFFLDAFGCVLSASLCFIHDLFLQRNKLLMFNCIFDICLGPLESALRPKRRST